MNNNTIKTTSKPCKGTTKAKGFGCGEIVLYRKYGLCRKCLVQWSLTTEQGKEYLKSIQIKAKKQVLKDEKQRIKAAKEAIKTKSDYEKKLQSIINKIVRLIDHDKGCVSCSHGWGEPFTRQAHAGHFHTVGSNPSLRFNMFNIFKQCSICNNHLSGNIKHYRTGLIDHYDFYILDMVETDIVEKYPLIKLSIPELKKLIVKARTIEKEILSGISYTRIGINKRLGIYE